jgi:hypothetical protein
LGTALPIAQKRFAQQARCLVVLRPHMATIPSWQAPFGARADRAEQSRILRAALGALRPARPAAAFDLDSTLLMNRVRQARIVREFGKTYGDARLAACPPEAIVSWDLADSASLCGLERREIDAVRESLKQFWRERFFTSEYCRDDEPVAGAHDFLQAVLRQGGEILYITGRHEEMGPGTIESFRAAGFPLPDGTRVQLWLKPKLADDDDAWKEICHRRLLELSGIACAFDNEPTHVNAYKRSFPEAVVVHLDTDHSRRPVEVLDSIPSIVDFSMEES